MKPGTKPRSPEQKKLEGAMPCRIPAAPEITPAPPAAPPPEYLCEVGAKKWAEFYPVLQECGVLKVSDLDILGGYCYAFEQFRACSKLLKAAEKTGYVETTPKGYDQASPYVAMTRQWMELMHRLGVELGMTPSARGRLNVPPTDKKKEALLAFLTRKTDVAPKS